MTKPEPETSNENAPARAPDDNRSKASRIGVVRRLRALGVIPMRRLYGVLALQVGKAFSEAFGMALLFPILKFIEHKQNITELAAQSRFWSTLSAGFGFFGLPVSLFTLSIAIFVVVCLRQLVMYSAVVSGDALKEEVTEKIREHLFRSVLASEASWIRANRSGHLVSAIKQHAQSAGSLVRNLITIFSLALTFAIYGSALLYAAPLVTIGCVLVGVLAAQAMKSFSDSARITGRIAASQDQDYAHFLQERFRSWRIVKLSGALDREHDLNTKQARSLAAINVRRTIEAGRVQLVLTPLVMIVLLLGLYVAVERIGVSLSGITLFVVVVLRLVPILEQFLKTRQSFANMEGALEFVSEVWDATEANAEPAGGQREFRGLQRGITFEDVSYRYAGSDKSAVSEISAEIPARKMTAIVGPSGSGKSTLVDLIPKIIIPNSGNVLIDDIPIGEFNLASLRSGIAYVSQDPLLFDDTIAANIRYARPEASDEDVLVAARRAHAEEFIGQLPDRFRAQIGESGHMLSGGQRQRIALARAFLSNASILIFDEPTSALDYESDQSIRLALRELQEAGQKTIVIIAHRASLIVDADHLIVVKDGRVIDAGNPATVASKETWVKDMLSGAAFSGVSGQPTVSPHKSR